MTMPQQAAKKRYGLFALALILLALAGVAIILGMHSTGLRFLGLGALLVSLWLVGISNVHARQRPLMRDGEVTNVKAAKRPGPVGWALGAASLVAAGASYLYMYSDALAGYHEALPVYAFAGVGVACAVIWGYLLVRILQ
jgi:hypothetical protein